MNEDRRKEIALLIVEQQAIDRGVPAADTLKRDLGNQAAKINVSVEELMKFYETFVPKIYARIFGYTSVSISASGRR